MPSKLFHYLAPAILTAMPAAQGVGTAVDSVVHTSGVITSITIDSVVYSAAVLANGTSTGGGAGVPIGNVDDLDMESVAGRDFGQAAWQTNSFNGSNYQDTNGSGANGYDFFVFEAAPSLGDTDDLFARIVLPDDSLGLNVQIAIGGAAGDWGSTGFTTSSFFNQTIWGTGFKLSDLLFDSGGSPLAADTEIKGLQFNGPGTDGVDPAVVVAVIPEPSVFGLGALSALLAVTRRRRHV